MFIYRTVGVVVLPRASSSFYLPHRLLLKFCALCDSSRVTLLYSINTTTSKFDKNYSTIFEAHANYSATTFFSLLRVNVSKTP